MFPRYPGMRRHPGVPSSQLPATHPGFASASFLNHLLQRLRRSIHCLNYLSEGQIRDRQVARELRLPWRAARRIAQDVCLTPDPDPNYVKLLQFESPVAHLLTPAPIVQLGLAKQIIFVIHIAKTSEPLVSRS